MILKKVILLISCICAFASFMNRAMAETQIETLSETQAEIDKRLGPWLELQLGGVAIGKPQGSVLVNEDGTQTGSYGMLSNASILPRVGLGYESVTDIESSAGTGMMISLIENSAAEINKLYPDVIVRIGDIARTEGGFFYPPHKSHQNGLDVDMLFIGESRWRSVLDADGNVTERFNFQKNWDYWRMITDQKILRNGREESAVSMILVAPEIKTAVCAWAEELNLLDNPLDREVMKRLRPTAGHDDHFHVRIHCSPYHAECTGTHTPRDEMGCS